MPAKPLRTALHRKSGKQSSSNSSISGGREKYIEELLETECELTAKLSYNTHIEEK